MQDLPNTQRLMVLDCTLRDGGYDGGYDGIRDFGREMINTYLAAMATGKVDIIEIGIRFLQQNKFLGAFAYSSDE